MPRCRPRQPRQSTIDLSIELLVPGGHVCLTAHPFWLLLGFEPSQQRPLNLSRDANFNVIQHLADRPNEQPFYLAIGFDLLDVSKDREEVLDIAPVLDARLFDILCSYGLHKRHEFQTSCYSPLASIPLQSRVLFLQVGHFLFEHIHPLVLQLDVLLQIPNCL